MSGYSRALRWLARVVSGVVLAASATVLGAYPAVAATTGSISGTVTVPANFTAGQVCVTAFPQGNYAGSGPAAVTESSPTTTGTYTLSGLSAGSYLVQFAPCSVQTNLVTQYYDGAPAEQNADPVSVTAGSTQSGVDATMAEGGTISGTVTVPSSFTTNDVCVDASPSGFGFGSTLISVGGTSTSAAYTITGLTPGSYTVEFQPCYNSNANLAPQYYPGVTTYQAANTVTVAVGEVTPGVDATMGPGATITGSVTVPSGAASEVCVSAQPQNGGISFASAQVSGSGTTGTYSILGLDTGTYVVSFRACSPSINLLTQYYNGVTSASQATPVDATAGSSTPGIDATMVQGGSITGTVSVPGSFTPNQVCVSAGPVDQSYYGFYYGGFYAQPVQTSGNFTLTGLPTGSFDVFFAPCGSSTDLAPQYYPGASSAAQAAAVIVQTGQTVSGVDASMVQGGTITGNLTVPGGFSTGQVCVSAYAPGLNAFSSGGVQPGSPATGGTYQIVGLTTGQYSVQFTPCSQTTNLLPQSDTATVTAGSATPSIDATLSQGGSISGTVTVPSGFSPSQVCINAQGPTYSGSVTWALGGTATSDTYTVVGLPTGSYTVDFSPCSSSTDLVSQYYDGSPPSQNPGPVQVVAGVQTTGVDASLELGGSITGTVTVPSGFAADQVCASAANSASSYSGEAVGSSGTSGSYTVTGLPPGSYTVTWRPCQPDVNLLTQTSASHSVTAGGVTSGVDATMSEGGSLTGTVKVPPNFSADEVCVTGLYTGSLAPVIDGSSPTTGTYSIIGLAAGSPTIEFSPCSPMVNLVSQSFSPTITPPQASTQNVTMAEGGTVTGTVQVPSGYATDEVCVSVNPPPNNGAYQVPVNLGSPPTSDTYTVTGLPTGTYSVAFAGCSIYTNLLPQNFANVSVTAGGSPTTQNVSMNPAAAPSAPGTPNVVGGNQSLAVTVPLSSNDGGVPVFAVTVTATDVTNLSAPPVTDTATSAYGGFYLQAMITVPGLANSDSYTVTATATNAAGTSPASPASSPVQPGPTPPGAPTGVSATAGDAAATVSFDAPAANGSPIEQYTATATDITNTSAPPVSDTATASPVAVTGLTNGDQYTFQVTATNNAGTGALSSPSAAVTVGVPAAPTGVTATAGNQSATVTFSAATPNAAPVTDYTVTATDLTAPGSGGQTAQTPDTSTAVTGLVNGDSYIFTATATNSYGTSPPSQASNAVVPTAATTGGGGGTTGGGGGTTGGGGGTTGGGGGTTGGSTTVSQTVPAGGSVSTGSTPTTSTPVQVAVMTPNAGTVTITSGTSPSPSNGFQVIGNSFTITAPPASVSTPLQLTFTVLGSEVPAGMPVTLTRNGVAATTCTSAGQAVPDPCIASETTDSSGNVVITILASHASIWQVVSPAKSSTTAACPPGLSDPFTDVAATDVHAADIACVYQAHIAYGTTADRYDPSGQVRRDQMASFLARLLTDAGVSLPASPPNPFTDVSSSDVHELAIDQLAALGITKGVTATEYEPLAVVSRAQMASFLVRVDEYVRGQALPVATTTFTDIAGDVHATDIEKIAGVGITEGVTSTLYDPSGPTYRNQMASFLARTLNLLVVAGKAPAVP